MINFCTYNNVTGEILNYGGCSEDQMSIQHSGPGTSVIEVSDASVISQKIHYFNAGAVMTKPESTITMSSSSVAVGAQLVLSAIPANSTIKVTCVADGLVSSGVMSGSDYITFDTAGEYIIESYEFPYLEFKEIVNVT